MCGGLWLRFRSSYGLRLHIDLVMGEAGIDPVIRNVGTGGCVVTYYACVAFAEFDVSLYPSGVDSRYSSCASCCGYLSYLGDHLYRGIAQPPTLSHYDVPVCSVADSCHTLRLRDWVAQLHGMHYRPNLASFENPSAGFDDVFAEWVL